jgi:hypothetical protein
MRSVIVLSFTAAVLIASSCLCQAGALDDPPPAVVQDPSLSSSHYFPPSVTNAGVANTGPALSLVKKTNGRDCNAVNPCAVLSPALDRAVPVHAG